MTTLVTGGTGTLGSLVVDRLIRAGETARVLSRRPAPTSESEPLSHPAAPEWATGDLSTGHGVGAALVGVGTVIHCATNPSGGDVEATRRLVDAARANRVNHIVYISIVGIERFQYSYYRSKLQCEEVITGSGIPSTIVRATQFHEFIALLARGLTRSPVVPIDRTISFQPIAASEVATVLCEAARSEPQGRAADLAGPEVLPMPVLVRAYLASAHRTRLLIPFRFPGRLAAGYRAGGHLAPERAVGVQTFAQYLKS